MEYSEERIGFMGWWDRQKRDVAKEIRKTLSEQGILVKIIFAVFAVLLGFCAWILSHSDALVRGYLF